MPQLFFDNSTYNIIIVVLLILIPSIINIALNHLYNSLSRYKNSINKSGRDCVFYFVNKNKIPPIEVYPTQSAGYLDTYSSKKNSLFLNAITFTSPDISTMSKVFYLIIPSMLDDKQKRIYDRLDNYESFLSLIYILLGPGLLWFGLLFKFNILVIIGLVFHLLYAIYHLFTYNLIKKRINLSMSFIKEISKKKEEKIYIKKIYKRQLILYLLAFFLESCKLFNFLLPRNMRRIRIPMSKYKK